jgi:hypothetical protein
MSAMCGISDIFIDKHRLTTVGGGGGGEGMVHPGGGMVCSVFLHVDRYKIK